LRLPLGAASAQSRLPRPGQMPDRGASAFASSRHNAAQHFCSFVPEAAVSNRSKRAPYSITALAAIAATSPATRHPVSLADIVKPKEKSRPEGRLSFVFQRGSIRQASAAVAAKREGRRTLRSGRVAGACLLLISSGAAHEAERRTRVPHLPTMPTMPDQGGK
jgi:hypothetical protein